MKVIFLDFDGVLITRASFLPPLKVQGEREAADPKCVAALNRITDQTGAQIVVSSTHRLGGLMHVKESLHRWGVTGSVRGITPLLLGEERGLEIAQWLKGVAVESFVILDDDDDMVHLKPQLIQTSMDGGLTEEHADKAIDVILAAGVLG